MQSRRALALACLIVLMIMWGSTFAITKATAQGFSPLVLAMLRFLIASLILVPIAWVRGGLRMLPSPRPWGTLVLMAATGIAGFSIAFTYALVFGSAAQGALIYAALPAAIAAAAIFLLGERPSKSQVAGIALSCAGVALLILTGEPVTDSPAPLAGALWMIGAVVAWTAYTVLAKKLAHVDGVVVIAIVSVLGTAMMVPLAAVEWIQQPWQPPSTTAIAGLLFLGVVASALAYLVYTFVLRELEASVVGVYTNLDPIVGVLIAVVWFGEALGVGQMIGGAIALVGMWLASRESETREGLEETT